jgi:diguanylate cyclase
MNRRSLLRDLLSRTLTFAVASLLAGTPELVAEAEALGAATKEAPHEAALAEIAAAPQAAVLPDRTAERRPGRAAGTAAAPVPPAAGKRQRAAGRRFSWLRGQIDAVQNLIAGPIDQRALEDATRSLKEVIYKQGQLKHSLSDVKATVKNMMMTFIDRLGTGGGVHRRLPRKIGGYSERSARPTISPN